MIDSHVAAIAGALVLIATAGIVVIGIITHRSLHPHTQGDRTRAIGNTKEIDAKDLDAWLRQ